MSELHNHRDELDNALQGAMGGHTESADDAVWENVKLSGGAFEQELRTVVSGYAIAADETIWTNILNALQGKRRRGFVWWQWAGAASVAAFLLFSANWLFTEYNSQNTGVYSERGTTVQQRNLTSNYSFNTKSGNEKMMAENTAKQEKSLAQTEQTEGETVANNTSVQNRNKLASHNQNRTNVTDNSKQKELPLLAEKNNENPASENAMTKMKLLQTSISVLNKEDLFAQEGMFDYLLPKYNQQYLETLEEEKEEYDEFDLAGNISSYTGGKANNAQAEWISADQAFGTVSYNSQSAVPDEIIYNPEISIAITGSKQFAKRWAIESGLSYSLLSKKSIEEYGEISNTGTTQQHFLGVPLLLNFKIIDKKNFTLYSSQGLLVDKGIYYKYTLTNKENGVEVYSNTTSGYQAGWQGGVLVGIGADYQISKHFSLYTQPSVTSWLLNVRHYTTNSRNASLLSPNLRAGVRVRI